MRAAYVGRVVMVVVIAIVVTIFARASAAAGGWSSPQLALAGMSILFGYIVARLSQAMFDAHAEHRRRARRWLIIAAAVPALVLTPTAIGESRPDQLPMILLAAAIWLALAMAFTSFVLARANRMAIAALTTPPGGIMKTNIQLHQDVLAELAWDPRVEEKDIGVAANDGIVTLTGSVASYAEKLAAERAVERVVGVKAVANDLTVNVPNAFAQSDTEIAKRVVDALSWDVQVPSTRVKTAVSNGWVTLEGDVEWRFQRDASARVVRNISGVRGVSNNITVTPKPASSYDVSRSIKEALERRADRTADHITVETRGSVVTLKGSVSSFGDRRAAEGAAWSAPGVTEVRDELAVVV